MILRPLAALGFAFALAQPPAAAAQQADFLGAKKVACSPDRMTRCKAAGVECETKEASPRDKSQFLVIDFEKKKVFTRRSNEERPFGDVLEDKVEGGGRSILIGRRRGDRVDTLSFRLGKDGKMSGTRDEGRVKMETTCAPAT